MQSGNLSPSSFFLIHLDRGIYTKEKWTLLLHSRSTLCKQYLNIQLTFVSLVTLDFLFLVSCFSDPLSDHIAPRFTAGIIYLWLTQSFFILAFGSWLPVTGQVGAVTQLAIWSSPKLAPQRSARPLLWNGFAALSWLVLVWRKVCLTVSRFGDW